MDVKSHPDHLERCARWADGALAVQATSELMVAFRQMTAGPRTRELAAYNETKSVASVARSWRRNRKQAPLRELRN